MAADRRSVRERGWQMKRMINLLTLVSGLLVTASPALGVSVIYAGDFLAGEDGLGIPEGSLVQLVASTGNGTFEAPTAGSFTGGGDDVVLDEARVDNFGGFFNDGSFSGVASFTLSDEVEAGDRLLIRWWPTLAPGEVMAPGEGTPYGEFRPEDDVTVTKGSDHPWVVPEANNANIRISVNVDFEGNVDDPEGDVSFGQMVFGTAELPPPAPAREVRIVFGAGDVRVRFLTEAGVAYRVERSGDLLRWDELQGGIAGDGGEVEVIDAVGNGGFFYRVAAFRP